MAFQTSITTPYGGTATYFKVVGINFNTLLNKGIVKLCGYTNEEVRHDPDARAIFLKDYPIEDTVIYSQYFSSAKLGEVSVDPIAMAYEYIKDTDEKFLDAVKV